MSKPEMNFRIVNAAGGDSAELFIYDDIGPDWAGMISGETVCRALAQAGPVKQLTVRINSPGGDVFEAAAIYNALVRHPAQVTIEIDGMAASAASLVAMAGNSICMAQNSMMMIHNAWTMIAGNRNDLLEQVAILDKVDGNIAATYVARTGQAVADVVQWMADETWMTADQAVSLGFADKIGQPLQVKAAVAAGRYRNTPAQLIGDAAAAPVIEPPPAAAGAAAVAAAVEPPAIVIAPPRSLALQRMQIALDRKRLGV